MKESPVLEVFWRVHFEGPLIWEEVSIHADPYDNKTVVRLRPGHTFDDANAFFASRGYLVAPRDVSWS
jgi:hypothetical protein